jgi:hypothetical protein
MKNSPQYSPEFVGADTRVVMETELLKLQQVLAEIANSIEKIAERVEALEKSE